MAQSWGDSCRRCNGHGATGGRPDAPRCSGARPSCLPWRCDDGTGRKGAPVCSYGLAPSDLLVEFARGLRGLEPNLVTELSLALVVLMHGQMRLVEACITAHQQAVNVLPAQVASSEASAYLDTASVSAEFEAHLRNPIERLQVLHPQLFAVEQHPFLEWRIFE